MHNQQQLHEQQEIDQQQYKRQEQYQDEHHDENQDKHQDEHQGDDLEQPQQQHGQRRDSAYAFESLEKAFATAVPHKIRSTKDLEQPKDVATDQQPWLWAKDIMLQKPVLKKSSQEVV